MPEPDGNKRNNLESLGPENRKGCCLRCLRLRRLKGPYSGANTCLYLDALRETPYSALVWMRTRLPEIQSGRYFTPFAQEGLSCVVFQAKRFAMSPLFGISEGFPVNV